MYYQRNHYLYCWGHDAETIQCRSKCTRVMYDGQWFLEARVESPSFLYIRLS